MISFFEEATGIDVPDSICGIEIPDPDIGDLAGAAVDLGASLAGVGDVVEKASRVLELLGKGTRCAGNCWGVIDRAADIISALRDRVEPLAPLFNPIEQAAEAFALFNKSNLDECAKIILDVLDLGKLLEKIMSSLLGVKEVFNTIMEACGDVVDRVAEFLADLAQGFAEALGLGGALDGVMDLFEAVKTLVCELSGIGDVLRPIVEAWDEANWFEAAQIALSSFDEVKDGLSRFMPAWDACQQHYEGSRDIGFGGYESAKKAWAAARKVVRGLCSFAGVEVPEVFGSRAVDVQPTVAPRGGLPPLEDEDDDAGAAPQEAAEGETEGDGAGLVGPEDASARIRSLFHRCKDLPGGLSHERFREIVGRLQGLTPEEVDVMIEAQDGDGNGVIDVDEWVDWLWGEGVCDEDREALEQVQE